METARNFLKSHELFCFFRLSAIDLNLCTYQFYNQAISRWKDVYGKVSDDYLYTSFLCPIFTIKINTSSLESLKIRRYAKNCAN